MQWIWEAWNTLNTCRAIGFAAGPIPWTAVQQYAEHHRLEPYEFDLLWDCTVHLDQVYREHLEAEDKKRQKKRSSKHGKPKRNTRR